MENYLKAVEALNRLTDAEIERAIQERKERGRRRTLADEERERGGAIIRALIPQEGK